MARPRLVNASWHDENRNHGGEDDTMMATEEVPSRTTACQGTVKKAGPSSLLQALGGKVPKKSSKKSHASHFVIGSNKRIVNKQDNADADLNLKQRSSLASSASSYNTPIRDTNTVTSHRYHPEDMSALQHEVIGGHPHSMMQEGDDVDHFVVDDSTEMEHETIDTDSSFNQRIICSSPGYSNHNDSPSLQTSDNLHHQDYRPTQSVDSIKRPSQTSRKIKPFPSTRTHIEIGADYRITEDMEGIEDHSIKPPLVVIDGANVAHAYGKAVQAQQSATEPDARGIRVACEYFFRAHLRVLVVLPAHWFHSSRKSSQHYSNKPVNNEELQKVVAQLDAWGVLVPAPPTDDDDAYALTIAQRENARALHNPRHSPGYVLSNDLFRDAQNRDSSGDLKLWLTKGLTEMLRAKGGSSLQTAAVASSDLGSGRISYTFCDMGRIDDRGEKELDFIPNPRHPLVQWIENSGALHTPADFS